MTDNTIQNVGYSREAFPDRSLHLAFLTNGIYPYKVGGIQKHTTNMVRYLTKAGVRVDLFVVKDERHPSASEILEETFDNSELVSIYRVSVSKLPYFPGHYYLTCYRQSCCFRDAQLESSATYDFIFAQGYMGWASARSRRQGHSGIPPVGIHGHGLEALQEGQGLLFNLKTTFAPFWQKINIGLADVNLSLGGRLDDLICSAGGQASSILQAGNGIDSKWVNSATISSNRNSKVKFLFVGRDTARKGFVELNAVLADLIKEQDFEFHFVGPIAESRRVESSKLIYHGEVRDEQRLIEIYRTCDVLVVPSHSEGMPTVILEAMASGLTVIATDVGAVNLLVNDSTGFLLPPRNSAALREAFVQAIRQDLVAKKMAAIRLVEEYTWDKVSRRFLVDLRTYLDGVAV